MRLAEKIAIVAGAGQGPGEGMGNGRATTLRFAREGAKILAVDRSLASATETAELVAGEGGECVPFAADVTQERTLAEAIGAARQRWGRVDILHNNVGVSIAGGDASLLELTEEAFDRVCAINLMPKCRCATAWGPPGTSPMPRCSSPRPKRISSP